MVRLVVLSIVLLGLSACSSRPTQPQEPVISSAELPEPQPDQESGVLLMDMTEGNHHPAIASLFAKAEAQKNQQNWSQAMLYLEQARQIQPRNPAILYRQAWLKVQQYQPKQAKQLLNRAEVYSSGNSSLLDKIQQLRFSLDSFQ